MLIENVERNLNLYERKNKRGKLVNINDFISPVMELSYCILQFAIHFVKVYKVNARYKIFLLKNLKLRCELVELSYAQSSTRSFP